MWISIVFLVYATCLVCGQPTTPPPGTADALESFPWIKASKVKARFGTSSTTPTPVASLTAENAPAQGSQQPVSGGQQQPIVGSQNPILTDEILKSYIAALTAMQLQQPAITSRPTVIVPPAKRPLKAKVPKQIPAGSVIPATTESYWTEERKEYPDSLYDEFYLDWLRKRQSGDAPIAAGPNPNEFSGSSNDLQEMNAPVPQQQSFPPPPPAAYPPMPMPPFNPFLYPFAGMKLSKAMMSAQVNAAMAAWNITTTPKPIKIKLKIPIPAGSDLAQVVASGIAAFPAGTTYDLSKKK